MSDPDAITTLQEKLTYLEQHVGELDALVMELNRDNAALKRQLTALLDRHQKLSERVEEAAGEPGDSDQALQDEKPPHW